jgi:hypothetical protein
MQAAITAVAQSGACAVNELAMIGSMAAFESWKSTTTAAKTNSGQLWKAPAKPSDQAAASRLGTPPRARSGSISADRICAKAVSVGTPSAAVKKKIAWLEK